MTAIEKKRMITQFLIHIGVPVRLRGFGFIREAIEISLENESGCYDMTNTIYPYIVRNNANVSVVGAERGIRYAIHIAWEQSNSQLLEIVFGYSNKQQVYAPSNREFIAAVTEYLRFSAYGNTVVSKHPEDYALSGRIH